MLNGSHRLQGVRVPGRGAASGPHDNTVLGQGGVALGERDQGRPHAQPRHAVQLLCQVR